MPATLIHKSVHHEMPATGDRVFEKFFEEVIASPELTLLDDVMHDEDQKPHVHLPAPYPATPHPYLHRLQSVTAGPPVGILKTLPYKTNPYTAIEPQSTTDSSASSGGGISPTLTWSGGPSPIDPADSPNLIDHLDVDLNADGEDFKAPLLFASPQSPTAADNKRTGRGRHTNKTRNSGTSPTASRGSSRSHSLRSHSSSIGASDELTMSDLSLHHANGTTSLRALLSTPPSPTGGAATCNVQLSGSAPARKKARTNSGSTRGSVDTVVDELMAPMMDASRNATRLLPTGHRRNITSAALVPLNAPTQVRNYLTPSSTSKKEIPSAFVARRNKLKAKEAAMIKATSTTSTSGAAGSTASSSTVGRKRSRSQAGSEDGDGDGEGEGEGEGVDELQEDESSAAGAGSGSATISAATSFKVMAGQALASQGSQSQGPTATPMEELSQESSSLLSAIEAKRRQNTLAARRSRQRKLDYVRNLEELLAAMTKERNIWKARAEKAEKILGYRPEEDDEEEEGEAEAE